jgi:tetratricopeptide (TPR) repeat protein
MPIATATVATIPSQDFIPSPTPTQVKQATPLEEAEEALNSGQPEKVRDLLYPVIETWTSNDDRVRGYELLGEAELVQGHAQLATPHFEKLYFYAPTAENLFILASVYDAGGDICHALEKYQELAKWNPLPPEVDIELVNLRIEQISCALGTPAPTKTAPPD